MIDTETLELLTEICDIGCGFETHPHPGRKYKYVGYLKFCQRHRAKNYYYGVTISDVIRAARANVAGPPIDFWMEPRRTVDE